MHTQLPAYLKEVPRQAAGKYGSSEMLAFNHMLNQDTRSLLNESVIENRLHQTLELKTHDHRLFWLTLARIAELAVYQAGAYADACEFVAAGDLLVNPRRIEIHLQGRFEPVAKQRHTQLSTQFKPCMGQESPVCWLSRETTPRTTSEAILPWLSKTLASSGMMARDYIKSLKRRMNQVADTLSFLICWQIDDSVELHQRIRPLDSEDAAFIESNLCRFGTDRFDAMYYEIEDLHYTNQCSRNFIA